MNNLRVFTPAILAVLLVVIYIILSGAFIGCWGFIGCQELNGETLLMTDNTKAVNMNFAQTNIADSRKPKSNTNLNSSNETANPQTNITPQNPSNATSNVNLSEVRKQVAQLKSDTDKLPESNVIKSVNDLQNKLNEGQTEPVKPNETVGDVKPPPTKTPDKTGETKTTLLPKANTDQTDPAKKAEASDFEKSVVVRYTSRVTWVFLTMLLCALFVGVVWFSVHVLIEAQKNNSNVQAVVWTPVIATIIGAVVLFLIGFWAEAYMPVVGKMFEKTIYTFEGISSWWFAFFNAIVFATVGFLVAAGCAIFYKAGKLNETSGLRNIRITAIRNRLTVLSAKTEDQFLEGEKEEKEQLAKELKELESEDDNWILYSKGLLYLGGAILTVGLMRISVLWSWFLAFIDTPHTSILTDYANNSLQNQAIFYTILLMLIYLPSSYSLPETSDSPSVESSFKDKGFFATLTKFAPPVIAILSPMFSPALSKLISTFWGSTG